jgi:hypothetical protein
VVDGQGRFNQRSKSRKGKEMIEYLQEHWMCVVGGFAAGFIVGMIL